MRLVHCVIAAAVLIPALAYSQATTPKISSISKLDANNDQKITKQEALNAGMPEVVFIKIDQDKNGEISMTEVNVYRQQNKSIAAIDTDKDARISKAEALKYGMSEREFKALDKDNNGYITQAEWDLGDWIIW